MAYDDWDYFERDFFSQTLESGAGSFFDVANVHFYPINAEDFPTMGHKVRSVREIMEHYGVRKPVWVTETGMWVNNGGTLERQRNFIVREQTRGFGGGADNVIWFAVRQARQDVPLYRWLVDLHHNPDNGYYTYQHYAGRVTGTVYMGMYEDVPAGVEAYHFAKGNRNVYLVWSSPTTQTVSLPSPVDAVLIDRDGEYTTTLPADGGFITFDVGLLPVFVEVILP